jgi:serine/alanine adding enzyme
MQAVGLVTDRRQSKQLGTPLLKRVPDSRVGGGYVNTEVVRALPEAEWRHFVDQHPLGNIFHSPEMFQVFARSKGHQPELWAARGNGRLLALMIPVSLTLAGGLLKPFTTRAIVYGGLLYEPGPEGEEALSALLDAYAKGHRTSALLTEVRNMNDVSDVQPMLNAQGFVFEEHLNYLSDLNQPVDALWSQVQSKIRQQVRKSEKSGVTIEEVTEPRHLEIVYPMLQAVYSRVHVPFASVTLFRAAFEVLGPRNMLKVVLARIGERCIGVHLFLMHKDRVFSWYVASDREFSAFHPEPAMIWHVLQWGATQGFRVFDFGGAGKPNEKYGPREFKSKFGGTLVNYGRYTLVHAPVRLWASQWVYQLWRKML